MKKREVTEIEWEITPEEMELIEAAGMEQWYEGSRRYVKGIRSVEAINGKWFGAYRHRYVAIGEDLDAVLKLLTSKESIARYKRAQGEGV